MFPNQLWSNFCKWLWNPSFWLPLGLEWQDVEKTGANFLHLLIYPPLMGILLLIIRYVTERSFLYPIAKAFGMKDTPKRVAVPNPFLESQYKIITNLDQEKLEGIAKKADMDERQLARWIRIRKSMDKPTGVAKFSESMWRLLCYSMYLSFGIKLLWDKDWTWNMDNCWKGFPHKMTDDVWWYYNLESSFYWSLMFSQFADRKRKDFWQMFLHHLVTIFLLVFSWICNFTRIGVIIAVLHDTSDPLLELVKLFVYTKNKDLGNVGFAIFMTVWIFTRLVIFPMFVLHSTFFRAHKILAMIPAYYVFNGMLLIILCLNIFWTYFIVQMAWRAVQQGNVKKDARSSSEDSCSE